MSRQRCQQKAKEHGNGKACNRRAKCRQSMQHQWDSEKLYSAANASIGGVGKEKNFQVRNSTTN